jgi:hypothetical protein
VLGTRAGREKYDQMKAAVQKLWNDPRVQQRVDDAQEFVKDKAPEVAEFLADGAKKVVGKVSGSAQASTSGSAPKSSASGASKSGSSTSRSTKTTS